jgi:hypothetical protein
MKESCRRYLENPEAWAGHPAECADCRKMADALDLDVVRRPLRVEPPLASWEGASHRPWPLVIGATLAVLTIAGGFFAAAGVSPLSIARMNLPSIDVMISIVRAFQNVPPSWQIWIGISFVIVNALFFFLLRRAPKGIDV